MGSKRIAAIAGDGIGNEVLPEGLRAARAAASTFGIGLDIVPLHHCIYRVTMCQILNLEDV